VLILKKCEGKYILVKLVVVFLGFLKRTHLETFAEGLQELFLKLLKGLLKIYLDLVHLLL